jgi:hypothetical protein
MRETHIINKIPALVLPLTLVRLVFNFCAGSKYLEDNLQHHIYIYTMSSEEKADNKAGGQQQTATREAKTSASSAQPPTTQNPVEVDVSNMLATDGLLTNTILGR